MLKFPPQNKAEAEETFEILEDIIAEIVAAEILKEFKQGEDNNE